MEVDPAADKKYIAAWKFSQLEKVYMVSAKTQETTTCSWL